MRSTNDLVAFIGTEFRRAAFDRMTSCIALCVRNVWANERRRTRRTQKRTPSVCVECMLACLHAVLLAL